MCNNATKTCKNASIQNLINSLSFEFECVSRILEIDRRALGVCAKEVKVNRWGASLFGTQE